MSSTTTTLTTPAAAFVSAPSVTLAHMDTHSSTSSLPLPASTATLEPQPTIPVHHTLSRVPTSGSLPPPYFAQPNDDLEGGVPSYEEGGTEEVNTMARSLFLYGFFFPPFWFLGALILITPLNPDPTWALTKPEEHIRDTLAIMRRAERRWAWRCVYACVGLLVLIAAIVGTVLAVKRWA